MSGPQGTGRTAPAAPRITLCLPGAQHPLGGGPMEAGQGAERPGAQEGRRCREDRLRQTLSPKYANATGRWSPALHLLLNIDKGLSERLHIEFLGTGIC